MAKELKVEVVVTAQTARWFGLRAGRWFIGLAQLSPFPPEPIEPVRCDECEGKAHAD
jgi:hypothetical protein